MWALTVAISAWASLPWLPTDSCSLVMHNLLIINNSEAIRQILVRMIRSADLPVARIYEASDGLQAIETLKQQPISLILSDANVSGLNGLPFLATINQTKGAERIPVVVISTDASHEAVREALRLGAVGYISKPFTVEHVREKLVALL